TGGVDQQAVVAAADAVALDATHRQRQQAVRAGVLQRGGGAVLAAKDDDGFAADGSGQRRAADLAVPPDDVPAVTDEHARLLALADYWPRHRRVKPPAPQR